MPTLEITHPELARYVAAYNNEAATSGDGEFAYHLGGRSHNDSH